jgi:hypothetical protein
MTEPAKQECPRCAELKEQIRQLREQLRSMLRPVDYKIESHLSAPLGEHKR